MLCEGQHVKAICCPATVGEFAGHPYVLVCVARGTGRDLLV